MPGLPGRKWHVCARGGWWPGTLRETLSEYGQLLEIDHGNSLATRCAHVGSYEVALGALVKRGQLVARVANIGRSTGARLQFEMAVDGVLQNPARFLAGSVTATRRPKRPRRRR